MPAIEQLETLVMAELVAANDGSADTVNFRKLRGLAPIEYCMRSEAGRLLDSLIYLPGVLDSLASDKYRGQSREVLIRCAGTIIRVCTDDLPSNGILRFLHDFWLQLLRRYDGQSPLIEHLSRASFDSFPFKRFEEDSLESLLSSLSADPKMFHATTKLLHDIFSDWIQVTPNAEHSLTVLDFMLRMLLNPTSTFLDIYRDDVIKKEVIRGQSRKRHFDNCQNLIRDRFGSEALQEVEAILLW